MTRLSANGLSRLGIIVGMAAAVALITPDIARAEQPQPLTKKELEEKLSVPTMDCVDDSIAFDCVTDYLQNIQGNLPKMMESNLVTIREKLERAEKAEEEFDRMIAMALGVAELAKEGGPLAQEIDRIGILIRKYEEEAANNSKTADLAPLFAAEFKRWEKVRDELLTVRHDALDVADLLDEGKARGVTLLRLKLVKQALNAAEDAVGGMRKIVDALNRVAEATQKELEVEGGSD